MKVLDKELYEFGIKLANNKQTPRNNIPDTMACTLSKNTSNH